MALVASPQALGAPDDLASLVLQVTVNIEVKMALVL